MTAADAPKSPKDWESWMEWCLAGNHDENTRGYARAELAALRADRDRLSADVKRERANTDAILHGLQSQLGDEWGEDETWGDALQRIMTDRDRLRSALNVAEVALTFAAIFGSEDVEIRADIALKDIAALRDGDCNSYRGEQSSGRDPAAAGPYSPPPGPLPEDLECSHCGDTAFTSPDGLFADGDGEKCLSCGFPGHVDIEEDGSEVWWLASVEDDARCDDPECQDCHEVESGDPLPGETVCPRCGGSGRTCGSQHCLYGADHDCPACYGTGRAKGVAEDDGTDAEAERHERDAEAFARRVTNADRYKIGRAQPERKP